MFSRLRCHYCGTRSPHSKGTTKFQCTECEAHNFFDRRGNVLDTPDDFATQSTPAAQPSYHAPPRLLSQNTPQRDGDVFCNRCRLNQKIYNETLANLLPDESHPRYREYEAGLPRAKAELEAKYPLVCKKCASKVQARIHDADYYGKTEQMARAVKEQRRRGASPTATGQRDDWWKWFTRLVLGLVGLAVHASLLLQLAWHAYGIITSLKHLNSTDRIYDSEFFFEPSFKECMKQTTAFNFDVSCCHLFAAIVPKTLLTSMCLIWYNPRLTDWYHPTYRFESIIGQGNHFRIQVLLWVVRMVAWFKLSARHTPQDWSVQQLVAAHGFVIALSLICQSLSTRNLVSRRWRLRGTITPRPDEVDIFADSAGPTEERYEPQASSVPPQLRLFQRNQKPFAIESLAPRQTRQVRATMNLPNMPPPSPPDSQSLPSDDEMDGVEATGPAKQPLLRSAYNYGSTQSLGWGGLRNELFSIEDQSRAEQERKHQELQQRSQLRYEPPANPSPFRGRLPPMPRSQEARLRAPQTQVSFKKQPITKQHDFMQQMREGIENGRGFARPTAAVTTGSMYDAFAGDDDFSPSENADGFTTAKERTKGSLDLRPGNWALRSDLNTATGLEDMFGGNAFAIKDEDSPTKYVPMDETERGWTYRSLFVGILTVVIAAGAWLVLPVRRGLCLWLVRKLEGMGY